MSEMVTLEISEESAQLARSVAERTGRDFIVVLRDWIDQSASEIPVEALSDEQVLALADSMMSDQEQDELSRLLAAQRERQIDSAGKDRLDTLMQIYRRGMVRKAQALNAAVKRGLRPPLS
jgi:hypothetical protein